MDPLTQTPPEAPSAPPLPNPVFPPSVPFQSMVERAKTTAPPLQPEPHMVPPGEDPARLLDEARQRDLQHARGETPPQQQTREGEQQQSEKPLLEPRRPNGRQAARANDWKHLEAQRDQFRDRATQLERELTLARAGGAQGSPTGEFDVAKLPVDKLLTHPELARLKQERDTFYEEVKHTRVEADPEFRAKFDSRRDAAIGIAKRASGGAADDIARILSNPDADVRRALLAERIKDFSDASKAKLTAVVGQLDALEIEREMEISSRKATWEQTRAAREAQQQQSLNQKLGHLENEFNAVLAQWSDEQNGMPFLVDERVRNHVVPLAKQVFSGDASPKQLAEASLKAALFGEVLKGWQAALQEVDRLSKANGRYAGAWPGSDTSYDPNPGASAPPAAINLTTLDQHFAGGLEAARQADVRGGNRWG